MHYKWQASFHAYLIIQNRLYSPSKMKTKKKKKINPDTESAGRLQHSRAVCALTADSASARCSRTMQQGWIKQRNFQSEKPTRAPPVIFGPTLYIHTRSAREKTGASVAVMSGRVMQARVFIGKTGDVRAHAGLWIMKNHRSAGRKLN